MNGDDGKNYGAPSSAEERDDRFRALRLPVIMDPDLGITPEKLQELAGLPCTPTVTTTKLMRSDTDEDVPLETVQICEINEIQARQLAVNAVTDHRRYSKPHKKMVMFRGCKTIALHILSLDTERRREIHIAIVKKIKDSPDNPVLRHLRACFAPGLKRTYKEVRDPIIMDPERGITPQKIQELLGLSNIPTSTTTSFLLDGEPVQICDITVSQSMALRSRAVLREPIFHNRCVLFEGVPRFAYEVLSLKTEETQDASNLGNSGNSGNMGNSGTSKNPITYEVSESRPVPVRDSSQAKVQV